MEQENSQNLDKLREQASAELTGESSSSGTIDETADTSVESQDVSEAEAEDNGANLDEEAGDWKEQRRRMLKQKNIDEKEKQELQEKYTQTQKELEEYRQMAEEARERREEGDENARFDEKFAELEQSRLERLEKREWLDTYDPGQEDISAVEEVKAKFPGMHWSEAYQFHLAKSKPEALYQPEPRETGVEGKTSINSGQPKALESMSREELRAKAIEEARGK